MITICSLESSPYQLWQLDLLYKSFLLNQNGDFLAIAHKQNQKEIKTCCPTFWTSQNYKYLNNDDYAPYNKIAGFIELFQYVNINDDEILMIVDPDCYIHKPINYKMKKGTIIAPYYSYMGMNNELQELFPKITTVTDMPPIGIPYIMHKSDLESILDRWLELCINLRVLKKDWICEMWAFSIAIQEAQIEVQYEDIVSFSNQKESKHILHYCDDMTDTGGQKIWSKRTYKAGEKRNNFETYKSNSEFLQMLYLLA